MYRHSYTDQLFTRAAGNSRDAPYCATPKRRATLPSRPTGRQIAYSDRNDLYVYDIAAQTTRRITDDGAWNEVINGTTDWVYEEEFGATRAYAFSPDSRRIAYLRFDESEVPLMEMMRFDGKLYNRAYSFKYPKAGERNSVVQLWICRPRDRLQRAHRHGPRDRPVHPRIGWTPDGRLVLLPASTAARTPSR
ncbi:MAG: DPP IV N-terminal domain-containing protein [Alistipes shahii]